MNLVFHLPEFQFNLGYPMSAKRRTQKKDKQNIFIFFKHIVGIAEKGDSRVRYNKQQT